MKDFSDEKVNDYFRSGACPHCGEMANFFEEQNFEVKEDNTTARRRMVCNECGRDFYEVFTRETIQY